MAAVYGFWNPITPNEHPTTEEFFVSLMKKKNGTSDIAETSNINKTIDLYIEETANKLTTTLQTSQEEKGKMAGALGGDEIIEAMHDVIPIASIPIYAFTERNEKPLDDLAKRSENRMGYRYAEKQTLMEKIGEPENATQEQKEKLKYHLERISHHGMQRAVCMHLSSVIKLEMEKRVSPPGRYPF